MQKISINGTLIFFSSHEDDRKSNIRELHCNYLGHLESEPHGCVAMAGCPGIDDAEVVVHSKHINKFNSFFWNKDGTVSAIKFEVRHIMIVAMSVFTV